MTPFTFPIRWQVPLAKRPRQNPVQSGPNVLVSVGTTLRAFARADGQEAWSVERAGSVVPPIVVVVAGGFVAATAEVNGERVERFGEDGRVLWELPGRWDLCPKGLVGANDRFLLAGLRRDGNNVQRVWEMSAEDGSIIRSVPGAVRAVAIAIDVGWAWVDDLGGAARVRMLDANGDRVVATADIKALASTGEWLFADGENLVRAYLRGDLVWESAGGKTNRVAADPRGIACGHLDGEGLWICAYALDGTLRWKTGPFPDGYPTIEFWNDLVIASGIYLGEGDAVAILDRTDGRVLWIESGGWGGKDALAVDGDAVFVTGDELVARREVRAWKRIEDAWTPEYTKAVAEQFVADEVALPDTSDLAVLRDAIADVRAKGRAEADEHDRYSHPVAWMFFDADWPLWALDLPKEQPERRIEMIMFDQNHDWPIWEERARIANYPLLRMLSLRANRLTHELGIDLSALPRLEYLILSENSLLHVPPEVRACRSMIHLDLRGNHLRSIDPADLPKTLRVLDIAKNHLSETEIAKVQAALPECDVYYYGQEP
jgi:hypothetical protein